MDAASHSGVRLRAAHNGDCAAVRTLVFEVLAEYGLKPHPTGTDSDLDDIERHYPHRGGSFSVLEDARGTICGSVGLYPEGDGVCELRKMYLRPAQRGKGLGRLLLEHALAEARRLGFRRVVLETAMVLKEAIALYERYGFRQYCPTHPVAPRCDHAMCLDLPAEPKSR